MNSHYPNYSNLKPIFTPVTGHKGMVSTQEKTATKVGVQILESGGNAIDAAVTIGFTLSVTLPRAGNIGGGGFMVIKDANNKVTAIDYREKAPNSATSDLFQDKYGNVIPEKPSYSFLSIGVPGSVYGLITALEKFGTISLKEALEPAIKLAKNGFPVYEDLYQTLLGSKTMLQRSPASMKVFFKDEKPYRIGETLQQKDLAKSLKKISEEGVDGFYKDTIAKKIVTYVKENDGILSIEDFEEYEPKLRKPIIGTYKEYDIFSMPPPSSGGILLVEMLNILEDYPLNEMGNNNAIYINLLSQVMKIAYYDRYRYLGDTDYEDVPVKYLTSKKYAKKQIEKIIDPECPKKVKDKSIFLNDRIHETTHFSVMDNKGNAVANTYSLALNYGSKFMVPDTGILLNNEMGDFTAKLGHIDGSGMKGGRNNTIKPGKRMLSSMTPTIIVKDDKPYMITGSVGGSLIITTVLQVALNVIEHKMNIAEAVNTPRFHRQWSPDHLRFEPGFSKDSIKLLKKWGHKIIIDSAYGGSQNIMYENDVFYGAADLRTTSAYAAGL
jgi:gamma-glutamyltranspeptidase/glutathione hydrolase